MWIIIVSMNFSLILNHDIKHMQKEYQEKKKESREIFGKTNFSNLNS